MAVPDAVDRTRERQRLERRPRLPRMAHVSRCVPRACARCTRARSPPSSAGSRNSRLWTMTEVPQRRLNPSRIGTDDSAARVEPAAVEVPAVRLGPLGASAARRRLDEVVVVDHHDMAARLHCNQCRHDARALVDAGPSRGWSACRRGSRAGRGRGCRSRPPRRPVAARGSSASRSAAMTQLQPGCVWPASEASVSAMSERASTGSAMLDGWRTGITKVSTTALPAAARRARPRSRPRRGPCP